MDEGDAAAFRLARAGGHVGRAVEPHGPGIGGHHAADDVCQGRLPGAVLPDEPQDAAARDPQRYLLQGGDPEEAPADAIERQYGVGHGCPLPTSRVRRTSSSAAARMIAALDHVDVEGREPHVVERVRQEHEEQHADEGPGNLALAAAQRGAADDGGADDVEQRRAFADGWPPALEARGVEDRGEAGAEAGEGVDRDDGAA